MASLIKVGLASSHPRNAQAESVQAAGVKADENAGSRLPSEGEIIARPAVSRTRTRLTIQNLTRRRSIETRRGIGIFVAQPKIVQELLGLTSFVENMQALGHKATACLVSRSIVPADEAAAAQLAILKDTPILKAQRVRLADGEPVSCDETYLLQGIGEKVVTNDFEFEPIFLIERTSYCDVRHPFNYERLHYLGAQICCVAPRIRRTDADARQPGSAVS